MDLKEAMNISSPCLKCMGKYRACHDYCPKYKDYKKKRVEICERRFEEIKLDRSRVDSVARYSRKGWRVRV